MENPLEALKSDKSVAVDIEEVEGVTSSEFRTTRQPLLDQLDRLLNFEMHAEAPQKEFARLRLEVVQLELLPVNEISVAEAD